MLSACDCWPRVNSKVYDCESIRKYTVAARVRVHQRSRPRPLTAQWAGKMPEEMSRLAQLQHAHNGLKHKIHNTKFVLGGWQLKAVQVS